MKKKYIIQSLLIIFEVCLVVGLITFLSNIWSNITDFNDFLTRFITFTAIYEFIIFIFNKNQLDARKDSLLTYKTILKQTLILIESPNYIKLKESILNKIEKLNDTSYYFIHLDILENLNSLKETIKNESVYNMRCFFENQLILIEHEIELLDLKWNNTFLLKLLK